MQPAGALELAGAGCIVRALAADAATAARELREGRAAFLAALRAAAGARALAGSSAVHRE
jgi:hypothetical protein